MLTHTHKHIHEVWLLLHNLTNVLNLKLAGEKGGVLTKAAVQWMLKEAAAVFFFLEPGLN